MAQGPGKKCTCTCTCKHCAAPDEDVDVCWDMDLQRDDFFPGQILSIPVHVSNMDPNLEWGNANLKLSSAGPVFSKYRWVVVFNMFQSQMECLPFYTNNGKGVTKKPAEELEEWIAVVDKPSVESPSEDKDGPLALVLYGTEKVKEKSYLHITESVTVEYYENTRLRGIMTWDSFGRLHERRVALDKAARKKAFEEDCRQRGK